MDPTSHGAKPPAPVPSSVQPVQKGHSKPRKKPKALELESTYKIDDCVLKYKILPKNNDYTAEIKWKGQGITHKIYRHADIVWKGITAAEFGALSPQEVEVVILPKDKNTPKITKADDKLRFVVELSKRTILAPANVPQLAPGKPAAALAANPIAALAAKPAPLPAINPAAAIPSVNNVEVSYLPQQSLHLVFLKNALDLALAIQKGQSTKTIDQIEEDMLAAFKSENLFLHKRIQEMTALLLVMDDQLRWNLVNTFVQGVNDNYLDNKEAFDGLTECLHMIQRATYHQLIEQAKASGQKDPVIGAPARTLTPGNLLLMVQLITGRLSKETDTVSKIEKFEPSHIPLLEAVVATLENMEMLKLAEVPREQYHVPFYRSLDALDLHMNLEVAYYVALGKQILVRTPDKETTAHAVARHAFYFGKCIFHLAEFAKELIPMIPVKVSIAGHSFSEKGKGGGSLSAPLGAAWDAFQKAIEFQEGKDDWYSTLFSLRNTCLGKDVNYLFYLKSFFDHFGENNQEIDKFLKVFHTHNPFFVTGFVKLLKQVIELYGEENTEVAKAAISIMERICIDNIETEVKKEDGLFKVNLGVYRTIKRFTNDVKSVALTGDFDRDRPYSQQLKENTYNILKNLASESPSQAIRIAASSAVRYVHYHDTNNVNTALNLFIPPHKRKEFPTTLFDGAIHKRAKWQQGFRNLYRDFCEDPQLSELRYYIPPEELRSTAAKPVSLKEETMKFLSKEDPNQVLMISGVGGSGKSLFVKDLVKDLWEKSYNEGFLPVYISLPMIDNPKEAILETLRKKGLDSTTIVPLLQSDTPPIKIVWIIDAVDEKRIGDTRAVDLDLFKLNNLKSYKGSKTIFTVRSDFLTKENVKNFYPDGSTPRGFVRLDVQPFNETRRSEFIKKFLDIRKKNGITDPWTLQQFVDYINPRGEKFKTTVSTALYLRILVETLPQIIKLRKKEGVDEKSDIVANDLMAANFCLTVIRDEIAQRNSTEGFKNYPRIDYLNYAIKAALAVNDYQKKTGNTWIPKEEGKRLYPDVFADDSKTERLRRCCGLIEKEKAWGFYHETFFSYFLFLSGESGSRNELLKNLNNDDYGFSLMIGDQPIFY